MLATCRCGPRFLRGYFVVHKLAFRGSFHRCCVRCNTANIGSRPLLGVPCSNAANIGERKTWTQSEFCTWQNSVRGQQPPKCIYSVPAQQTAKHRAKFGWPPLSDVGAVTKPRRETRWNLLRCPKLTNRSQPLVGRSSPCYKGMWMR